MCLNKYFPDADSPNPRDQSDHPLGDETEHSGPTDPEAFTRSRVREQLVRRFEHWLDGVLAEEGPVTGIGRTLLDELEGADGSGRTERRDSTGDLFSTWSAITALTQEVKLQGRAFKQLSDRLPEQAETVDRLINAYDQVASDALRFSEQAGRMSAERENACIQSAYARLRNDLISVLIDIRDRLAIGLAGVEESRRNLDARRHAGRLKRVLLGRGRGTDHLAEIADSLQKGYRLSLEQLDEAMRSLEIYEIVCHRQAFDPQLMAVADIEETDVFPDGTVIDVYRSGYMIGEAVFRPAQVKVSRFPAKDASPPAGGQCNDD